MEKTTQKTGWFFYVCQRAWFGGGYLRLAGYLAAFGGEFAS